MKWDGYEVPTTRYRYESRTVATGNKTPPRLHVAVAERALGRPLPEGAVVHHVDENRHNNRNDNLVICPDHAYHHELHYRLRVLRAGGDPFRDRLCISCGNTKPISEFSVAVMARGRGWRYVSLCKECNRLKTMLRRQRARGTSSTDDPLSAARGAVIGALLAIPFWVVVGLWVSQ